MESNLKKERLFSTAVIVAALGYFVDIYDLLLFSIIRVPSLKDLGVGADMIKTYGEDILSWQMMGLLIGGIIWGIMGDKKGRLSVLFGSILLYSLANLANGFVQTVDQYKWIRFIAGIGLAGELGAGITLVSELTSKEKRGIATSLVAGIGLSGAVLAFIFKESFHWRTCCFIGGGMGFILLMLRISVFESNLYQNMKIKSTSRGNFFMLFNSWARFKRYFLTIMIGLPTWLCIGILVTFSKEFGEALHIKGEVDPGKAIMYAYVAISIGDIIIGFVSQFFKSRKTALYIFFWITSVFIVLFFTILKGSTPETLYWICAGLGFGTGYWAIFVTMAAEQFGTNIRATATTSIPNMVRGMLAVMILPMFKYFRIHNDYLEAGIYTSIVVMVIAFFAVWKVEETFGKDLNFNEE
jgi:putative MFS transporter